MSATTTHEGGAEERDNKLMLHPQWFRHFRLYLSEQVFGVVVSQVNASALFGFNGQYWKLLENAGISTPYETFWRAASAVAAGYVPVLTSGPYQEAIAVRTKLAKHTSKEVSILHATVTASFALESLAYTASDLRLPPIPLEKTLIDADEFNHVRELAAPMKGKRQPRLKIAA